MKFPPELQSKDIDVIRDDFQSGEPFPHSFPIASLMGSLRAVWQMKLQLSFPIMIPLLLLYQGEWTC